MNEVTTSNGTALMSFIERAAKDPEFDVQKFGELLRLQRDVGHDQAQRAFNTAMAAAQAEMLPVVRDAANSHLGNKYAKLETIDQQMRPIYTRHGFSVRYGSAPAPREGDMRITCTVAHNAGYSEVNYLDAPSAVAGRSATTPVQAVGSVITYLRRYLLTMVFNIVLANEDDDGEAMREPLRAAAAAIPRAPRVTAATAAEYEGPPKPPQRTPDQLLDGLEIAMRDCGTLADVNKLIANRHVQDMLRDYKNGHKARLDGIIAAGIGAHAPVTHEEDAETWPGADVDSAAEPAHA